MKKRLLITEEEKKQILKLYGIKNNLINEAVTITSTQKATYEPGQSDPSGFIDTFVETLLTKINENSEAKDLLSKNKLMLEKVYVAAGSSNNWNGVKTSYDLNNKLDTKLLVTVPTDKDNVLYNKNLALAKKRGETFLPSIIAKLQAKGIKVSNSYSSKVTPFVVDTGGMLDSARDETVYKNPGQYIGCSIIVGNEDEIQKFNKKMLTLSDIKKDFVLTGSYYCDQNNAINRGKGIGKAELDTYSPMCNAVQKLYSGKASELAKYISAFEIKWQPNVLKNPWVYPVMRWEFTWADDGAGKLKISSVKLKEIKKSLIPASIFPSTESSVDDTTLKYMMGLTEGDTAGGGTIYKTYIEPYK
jgi:hypothetical protein